MRLGAFFFIWQPYWRHGRFISCFSKFTVGVLRRQAVSPQVIIQGPRFLPAWLCHFPYSASPASLSSWGQVAGRDRAQRSLCWRLFWAPPGSGISSSPFVGQNPITRPGPNSKVRRSNVSQCVLRKRTENQLVSANLSVLVPDVGLRCWRWVL